MSNNFIKYRGKKYPIESKGNRITLKLSYNEINDISKIKDLNKFSNIQILELERNQIPEIKGLENLPNLLKKMCERDFQDLLQTLNIL